MYNVAWEKGIEYVKKGGDPAQSCLRYLLSRWLTLPPEAAFWELNSYKKMAFDG